MEEIMSGHGMMHKAHMQNEKHGRDLVASLSDLHATGQFADVKLVCADGSLWSHRPLLAAVSPVLHKLLLNRLNDDIVTLILPQVRRTHLKLVLDYVYSGSMYLRASQMQYVIGVIEVLYLKKIFSILHIINGDLECKSTPLNTYDHLGTTSKMRGFCQQTKRFRMCMG